jgi:outer membrane protein OmpA-like peptidoglycan-associated protein
MKAFLATTCIVTGALLAGGCASKKYVRNTTAPIQAKVDQVGEQTSQNSTQIQDTRTQVTQVDQRAQSGISAAQERAATADQHAGEAMTKANQAGQTADQAVQGVNTLRSDLKNVVANLDDYKLQTTTTVPFKFNSYVLSKDAQAELDKLVSDVKSDKRFFIAVEGYTDNTGSKQYNEDLSRRRADAVVNYLVAQHDVPIYRIHMIGLGKDKPVDDARTRAARAKNRRVEVKVFTADQVSAALSGDANRVQQQQPENK